MAYFLSWCWKISLCQARLLRGHIAPLFHDRLLHLPGIGSRPGAHLLWHVHALLDGFQLGHKLRHMLARSLRFKTALLLWCILHHSLNFVVALQWTLVECACAGKSMNTSLFEVVQYLLEAAASRSADLPRLFCATSDGSVLLHGLLGHSRDRLWFGWSMFLCWEPTCRPLEATLSTQWWWCSQRCWADTSPPPPFCIPPHRPAVGSLWLRLDFNFGTSWSPGRRVPPALSNTLTRTRFCEKWGFLFYFCQMSWAESVRSPADLLPTTVAVFYKRFPANSRLEWIYVSIMLVLPTLVWSHRFVESDLLVFNEAVLPEVFLALLLLLGLILGDKCLMTP